MKIQVIACFLLIGVTVHDGKLSEKKIIATAQQI